MQKSRKFVMSLLFAVMLIAAAPALAAAPENSVARPVFAGGGTVLYGGIGRGSSSNPGSLIRISQGTGAGTLVGHPDSVPGLTGLAFGLTGALYGSTVSGPAGGPRVSTLVSINPQTGAQIGPALKITVAGTGLPLTIADLAVQPRTGRLYGNHLDTDTNFINSLYVIDPATGVATLIGSTGLIGASIAFEPRGTLYMSSAIFDDTGAIFIRGYLNTVDPNTAAVLTTSQPFTLHHVGGLAVRPTDGVIFASGGDAGDIYTLSPTGAETLVGLTGAGGAGDLAFTPTHDTVKEAVAWTIPAGQCQSLNVTVDGTGQRNETINTVTNADGSSLMVIDDVVVGAAVDSTGLKYNFFYANHSTWNTPAAGTPVQIRMDDLFLLQSKGSAAANRSVVKAAFVWSWTYDPNTAAYWPPVDNFVQTHTVGDPINCDPI